MVTRETIFEQINDIFGEKMHAKRVASLVNAAHGVTEAGSLEIHTIGNGLAQGNEKLSFWSL